MNLFLVVLVFVAVLIEAHPKSGGFAYMDFETNEVKIGFEITKTVYPLKFSILPCRAMDTVSADLKPYCMSCIDADNPEWYFIHHDGKTLHEPEYDPTFPEFFDDDASWLGKMDTFFPGFGTYESVSHPEQFSFAGSDKYNRLGEVDDTVEAMTRASYYLPDHSKKGESVLLFNQSIKVF